MYWFLPAAVAYGDPHFMTFDGNNFTFNGFGEFWLLHAEMQDSADNINIQIRMRQPEPGPRESHVTNQNKASSQYICCYAVPFQPDGTVNGTKIIAVAAREHWSDQGVPGVQIELPESATSHTHLLVMVDEVQIDMTSHGMRYQEIHCEKM